MSIPCTSTELVESRSHYSITQVVDGVSMLPRSIPTLQGIQKLQSLFLVTRQVAAITTQACITFQMPIFLCLPFRKLPTLKMNTCESISAGERINQSTRKH